MRLAQSGILAAAVDVFARKGVAATRVEDLLEAAGIARRTFYKYFGGKEDVLASLYDLATAELLRAVVGASEESGDPLVGIRRGIDLYFDYCASNSTLIRLLVEQAIRSDSPLAPLRRRFQNQLVGLLERATRGAGHDRMMYVALIAALEGMSLQVLENGAEPSQIARAKATMHALLDRVVG